VASDTGLLAVREAAARDLPADAVRVTLRHFLAAIEATRSLPRRSALATRAL
jgi:hypothetical protein